MKKLTDAAERLAILSMANHNAVETGLPGSIFVFTSGSEGSRHGPRIKVSNLRGKFPHNTKDSSPEVFSVSVSDTPEVVAGTPKNFSTKELSAVYAWVTLNLALLQERWGSDTMTTREFDSRMKPLL